MRLLVLLGWVWVLFGVVKSDDPLAGIEGGEVLLKPNDVAPEITSITWKEGPNLAVQWDGTNINYYRQFKKRSSLDVKTGSLMIRDLVISDSNDYTPEINNVLQSKIVLKVYRHVQKPTIQVKTVKDEYCDLTCHGDITDAEPVTYSWAKDKVMFQETSREIIRKWVECYRSYTCTVTNPVSAMESEAVIPVPGKPWITGLAIGLVLLALIPIVIGVHKLLTGVWFFQKDSKCWNADFWKKSTNQSGNAEDKEETSSMAKDNRG